MASLTASPAGTSDQLVADPADLLDALPITNYNNEEYDTVDRELAAFFTIGEDGLVPRDITFEERWHHMSWPDHKREIGRLLDALDTTTWRTALDRLHWIAIGVPTRQSSRDPWIISLKRTHTGLAQAGFLACLWPRLRAALDDLDAVTKTSIINSTAASVVTVPADLRVLLGCMFAHVLACFHFQIPLDFGEPPYALALIRFLARADPDRTPLPLLKKVTLTLWKLLLGHLGDLPRARAIKETLMRFYHLTPPPATPATASPSNSPVGPAPPPFETKASPHDYAQAWALLVARYPAIDLPAPPPRQPTMPTPPTAHHPPRRMFAARKKVSSQDHLLLPVSPVPSPAPSPPPSPLPGGGEWRASAEAGMAAVAAGVHVDTASGTREGEGLPLPLREYVETFKKHQRESLFAHMLPQIDPEYPSELDEYVDAVKSIYSALLPDLDKFLQHLLHLLSATALTPPIPHPTAAQAADRRERDLAALATASILSLLLRHTTLVHPLMGSHLAHTLVDGNGLVPLLQVLNVPDIDRLWAPTTAPPPSVWPFPSDLVLPHTAAGSLTAWSAAVTAMHVLRMLRALTKGHVHRVLFLYQHKTFNVMKRWVGGAHNYALVKAALKLVKAQMPFMSRKWRQSNIALISLIYHHLTPKLVDDYLMTTDPEAEAADGLRHEEHICTLITSFHAHHFPDVVHAHHPRRRGTATPDSDSDADRPSPVSTPLLAALASLHLGDDDDEPRDDGVLEEWRDEYEETMQVHEWWKQ
ncbi:Factor arrest protein 11 [Allomyces javanicus]|nr:Factor arrest protein 11 [Allomyces javanicus]